MSIRPDALPATNDDLLRMRGRGWLSNFPVGNSVEAPGLPMVNTSRWDTGVQVHGVTGTFEWTGAVTAGSLSDPRFHDNNAGRQYAGRLVARPTAGAGARRLGVTRRVAEPQHRRRVTGPDAGDRSRQTAFGGDAEFSAGPLLIRGEAIRSTWTHAADRHAAASPNRWSPRRCWSRAATRLRPGSTWRCAAIAWTSAGSPASAAPTRGRRARGGSKPASAIRSPGTSR